MKAGKVLSLLFLLILILFLWSVATSNNEEYKTISPDYMDPDAYNFLAGEIRPSDASINPLML